MAHTIRYQVIRAQLDGTNDLDVPVPQADSITIYADTTSTALSIRPSRQSDFLVVNGGDAFNFEPIDGEVGATVITLRAAAALTVYVVLGISDHA